MNNFVVGRIVPAIATTTALVSGLVCLEVLKIAGERKKLNELIDVNGSIIESLNNVEHERLLNRFKNSFANLALPMLASTQPVPAETYELPLRKVGGKYDHEDEDKGVRRTRKRRKGHPPGNE